MKGYDPKDRGYFEQTTMQRALGDVFGSMWTELAMTDAEFKEVIGRYLTRVPTGPGQPPAMVNYHNFARDLQKLADETLTNEHMSYAMSLKHASGPKGAP